MYGAGWIGQLPHLKIIDGACIGRDSVLIRADFDYVICGD